MGDKGLATLRLLQGGAHQCRDDPKQWQSLSPFKSSVSSATDFLKSHLDDVEKLAYNMPLVIIDWDSETRVHGRKVLAVARSLLHELGLDALNKHILFVELNPTQKGDVDLTSLVKEFGVQYHCPNHPKDCDQKHQDGLISSATRWLQNPDKYTDTHVYASTPDQLIYHEGVLQAVLWKYFNNQSSWVNMSFEVGSYAIEIMQNNYLAIPRSFGVSAASDTVGIEQEERFIPQAEATHLPNFMNVTSGDRSGLVLRAHSSPDWRTTVTAVGPDCGYDSSYDTSTKFPYRIAPTDYGTSFASPYVATWSWIRYLLDEADASKTAKTDPSHMRRAVIEASSLPGLPEAPAIESRGIFDPPRLLLTPVPRVIDSNNVVRDLKSGLLSLYVPVPGAPAPALQQYVLGVAVQHITISFFSRGSTVYARIRTLTKFNNPQADHSDFALADNSALDALAPDGTSWKCADAATLLSKCQQLIF